MPFAPDLSGHALDDRYELHAVIGEGAFGRVYRGRDRRLARPVAIKVIKPWWAEDPEWVASFEREAQLLARVSDPGIVQIFDVGHAPEGLYYVSELVDGENLAGRLRRGRLAPWEACDVAAQLCRALAHAHAQRIVHRDVKPANILLSAGGRVKVGDFGVAQLAEGSTDGAAATIIGTPKYMAPEQGRGRPTTPATDIYSVGVVLYEMLCGSPPFAGSTAVELALRHLQDPPPPLSVRLPAALVAIVERALAKDPAQRYADGAEMAEALVDARRPTAGKPPVATGRARTRTAHHLPPARALTPAGAPGRGGSERSTALLLRDARSRPQARGADVGVGLGAAAWRPPHPPDPTSAGLPPHPPDPTRPAPRSSPRRNVNPPARRRAAVALCLAVVLLAAMLLAAVLVGRSGHTRVPELTNLSAGAAGARARRGHVHVVYSARYAKAPGGTAISQRPVAGTRVTDGTTVRVVLSRGPAPIQLPPVLHESSRDARATLTRLGLASTVTQVPAPAGTTPGTVTAQSPAAGGSVVAKSAVALSVAETPRWRPLTTFTGTRSIALQIRGGHWRIVYRMAYQGTCTFVVFCSGPSVHVVNLGNGSTVGDFGLDGGTGQIHSFQSGPGLYLLKVSPGSDDARWSVEVDDDY